MFSKFTRQSSIYTMMKRSAGAPSVRLLQQPLSSKIPQSEPDKEIINHGCTRINTDLETCISFTHRVNCRFFATV
jgi:hypothetical protein